MSDRNAAIETVGNVKDMLIGLAAAGASVSGWKPGQAALIGLKAEESATSRIAGGESTESALASAIGEGELVLALDVFSKTLDETGDVRQAFDRVVQIKREALADVPFGEATIKAAEVTFSDALKGGISPHAALASAFVSAAAVARLSSAGKH
ncbi:MAG: hypothetical protein JJU21_13570 [Salinarimonas sp.]|nr:hypothetical protein [Salinarimonas sp.]